MTDPDIIELPPITDADLKPWRPYFINAKFKCVVCGKVMEVRRRKTCSPECRGILRRHPLLGETSKRDV
jgi:hypothetical protein